MKCSFLTIFLLLSFFNAFAQVPQSFSYQAVARDNNGSIIVSKQISIRLSILAGSASGEAVYAETHSVTTNQFGIVNLEVGKGTSNDQFNAINWATGQFWLKVEMDVNGGNTYNLIGSTQLLSVPFALYAANTPSCFDLQYPDGFSNMIGVIQEISSTKSYTVPSGKNLYIQNFNSVFVIDQDTLDRTYHPLLIAGSNQIIKGISSENSMSGILVDASVTPLTINLSKGEYTVPKGKVFVLYSIPWSGGIKVNGIPLFSGSPMIEEINFPLVFTDGQVLSASSLVQAFIINGYLK